MLSAKNITVIKLILVVLTSLFRLVDHQPGTVLFQQPRTALLFEQSGTVLTHQPPGTALFQQPRTALLFEQPGTVLTHQPGTALFQQPRTVLLFEQLGTVLCHQPGTVPLFEQPGTVLTHQPGTALFQHREQYCCLNNQEQYCVINREQYCCLNNQEQYCRINREQHCSNNREQIDNLGCRMPSQQHCYILISTGVEQLVDSLQQHDDFYACTQQKTHNLFWPDETALNNVVLPTLFKVVNNIVQHCYT